MELDGTRPDPTTAAEGNERKCRKCGCTGTRVKSRTELDHYRLPSTAPRQHKH